MEKKIYALQGKSNCGKTTTLKKLYELLINQNGTLIQFCKNLPQVDILAVVIIRGVRVGIVSQGDVGEPRSHVAT